MFAFVMGGAMLGTALPQASAAEPPKVESVVPSGTPAMDRPLITPPRLLKPVPGGNLLTLFRPGDYPKAAQARKQQGMVSVRVHVDAIGKVDRCDIARSTGSATLDETTCAIIADRARFAPARNKKGEPVDVTLEEGFSWQLDKPVPVEMPKLLSVVLLGDREARADRDAPIPRDRDGKPTATGLLSLFSSDDYPAEALRKEEEGTTAVRLDIDAGGQVSGCTVVETSRSPSLDATTCRILTERARFEPLRRSGGKAVTDHFNQRVRWMLPERMAAPFADLHGRMILRFDAKGEVASCRSEDAVPHSVEESNCSALKSSLPPWITPEERVGRTMVFEAGFVMGGPEAAQGIGQGPGQSLVSLVGMALAIDAEGKVVECQPTGYAAAMPADDAENACADVTHMRFAPLDASEQNRSNRHGVNYYAAYFEESK